MKALVVGAGIVGVTTARMLARRGYEVTVVDAHEGPGLETSYANAGQRSYGHVSPWAAPNLIGVGLKGLVRRQGPLKMPMPPAPRTMGFLLQTLRYAWEKGRYEASNRAMLQLGQLSQDAFHAIDQELPEGFDGQHAGLLEISRDPAEYAGLQSKARALAEQAIDHEWLAPDAVRRQEPALATTDGLQPSLLINGDGTGDCHRLSWLLMEQCREAGVRFLFNTSVTQWAHNGHALEGAHVSDGDSSWLEAADTTVVCAGCASRDLTRPLGLKLPVYPVKGYSLTAPLEDPGKAPRSTVVDLDNNVAITRLGDRMRVTGFAELNGFNRRTPESRLQVLQEAVNERFPGAAAFHHAEPWTGFRPMLPDGPPALGAGNLDNLWINTGHGTFGWTLSAGSAELLGLLMHGETPRIATQAFNPRRF
ncbi:D-amino acid dehydrogenase [Halomonadaceae bacterium KBTZ08]